jgi:hypothetical protein
MGPEDLGAFCFVKEPPGNHPEEIRGNPRPSTAVADRWSMDVGARPETALSGLGGGCGLSIPPPLRVQSSMDIRNIVCPYTGGYWAAP